MSKRLAAVLGVSYSEIENLQTVFQNGLTFTLVRHYAFTQLNMNS